jgi:hypothetical protein
VSWYSLTSYVFFYVFLCWYLLCRHHFCFNFKIHFFECISLSCHRQNMKCKSFDISLTAWINVQHTISKPFVRKPILIHFTIAPTKFSKHFPIQFISFSFRVFFYSSFNVSNSITLVDFLVCFSLCNSGNVTEGGGSDDPYVKVSGNVSNHSPLPS